MASRNKILIIAGLALLVGGIYYSGVYTYFQKKEVMEERPVPTGMEPEQARSAVNMLKSGSFVDANFLHRGSGQALLLEYPDGRKILRFENLDVTSGPDLYVYLSKSVQPTGDTKSLGDYIDLGLLKGTSGNQNYEINQDITGYKTAVIWCKRFGVLFSYAVMGPSPLPLSKENLIRVENIKANDVISSSLTIKGEARGNWFFEASFPIVLTDWDGRIIAEHYATAKGEWMTEDFVPFEAVLEFESPVFPGADETHFSRRGFLILRKDNPSGLPEHDDVLEIPVFFK